MKSPGSKGVKGKEKEGMKITATMGKHRKNMVSVGALKRRCTATIADLFQKRSTSTNQNSHPEKKLLVRKEVGDRGVRMLTFKYHLVPKTILIK